jgi:hypothetical protein
MAYPDVERLLVAWLNAHLNVRVLTDTPSNLEKVLPVVQITRFGGADTAPGIDRAIVDVDCYGATRAVASQLAEHVRYALLYRLAGSQHENVAIADVSTLSGPSWRPYDNTALRRFGASYAITTHAMTIREV